MTLRHSFVTGVGDQYQVSWRMPVAIQCTVAGVVFCGIWFLPESPRWLLKHGYKEEAYFVLSALNDRPANDPIVQEAGQLIETSIEAQRGMKKFEYKELFSGGQSQNFRCAPNILAFPLKYRADGISRRLLLGIFVQGAQQISGINVVNTYEIVILKGSLGLPATTASLLAGVNGTQYFLATACALIFIERVGRRKLLITTAFGQFVCFFSLPFLLRNPSKASQAVSVALIFLFNTLFGLAWVGIPFLYNAESSPLRIRSQANAIGSSSNWIFCFIT